MTEQTVAPVPAVRRIENLQSALHRAHAEIGEIMDLPDLMGPEEASPRLTPAWSDLRNAMTAVGIACHLVETARARVIEGQS